MAKPASACKIHRTNRTNWRSEKSLFRKERNRETIMMESGDSAKNETGKGKREILVEVFGPLAKSEPLKPKDDR